jgi:hypothetical protein
VRIADTKNIDHSNAYCGIGPARYHAYLRVERTNESIRTRERAETSFGAKLTERRNACASFEWASDRRSRRSSSPKMVERSANESVRRSEPTPRASGVGPARERETDGGARRTRGARRRENERTGLEYRARASGAKRATRLSTPRRLLRTCVNPSRSSFGRAVSILSQTFDLRLDVKTRRI